MSTRALYTFTDQDGSWNVYKHSDGYPSGAARVLQDTVKWFTWQLPRFEADEFAAGFCAAGKAHNMLRMIEGRETLEEFKDADEQYGKYNHGGQIRMMPQGDPRDVATKHCVDIEYRYEISQHKKGTLMVACYSVNAWDDKYEETAEFEGSLDAFTVWTIKEEETV